MIKYTELKPSEFFASSEAKALCERYAAECANPAFGSAPPDISRYADMERLGMIEGVAVKDDDRIVGFGAVTIYPLPHFKDKLAATLDSVFLDAEYRKGMTGVCLIERCLTIAKRRGAVGLYMSAVAGSRLERLASRLGKHTNSVYFLE